MPDRADDPVVASTELSLTFDESTTLRFPCVQIRPGEHTVCIGPSGCGKTTLLRLLTGILSPTEGQVSLDGRSLARLGDAARRALRLRRVGMVVQDFALIESLHALDNILLPARIAGADLAAASARARDLADRLAISHVLPRRPGTLSQGERQRVAICRAMVLEPALLVCDEPTGNLDPSRAGDAIELLKHEADRSGATLLVVTHDHSMLGRFRATIDLGIGAHAGGA